VSVFAERAVTRAGCTSRVPARSASTEGVEHRMQGRVGDGKQLARIFTFHLHAAARRRPPCRPPRIASEPCGPPRACRRQNRRAGDLPVVTLHQPPPATRISRRFSPIDGRSPRAGQPRAVQPATPRRRGRRHRCRSRGCRWFASLPAVVHERTDGVVVDRLHGGGAPGIQRREIGGTGVVDHLPGRRAPGSRRRRLRTRRSRRRRNSGPATHPGGTSGESRSTAASPVS